MQPAEPRSGWAKEPPEERAVELARTLESRRYLEGGSETEDVAALLVEAAGSLSIHTSVSSGLALAADKCSISRFVLQLSCCAVEPCIVILALNYVNYCN